MAAREGKGKTDAGKRRGTRKERGARKPGVPPAPAVVRETAVLPELMDRVKERREEIVITKYGKPVAKLVPVSDADAPRGTAWGWMKGTVLWYGDVISPIDVEWEAMKD
jgi:prevent-host-death family protein